MCVWIVKVSIKGNIEFLKVDFNNYYQTLPKYNECKAKRK